MAKYTEIRLTMAAFIFGIETDLRLLLKEYVVPHNSDLSFLRNPKLEESIISRFQKDYFGLKINDNLPSAVDYLDFQDAFVLLMVNADYLPNHVMECLKRHFPDLEELTPIRNRVMHSRPLMGGDFATVLDFVSRLNSKDGIPWVTTLEFRKLIENDPNFVLSLSIPSLKRGYDSSVIHNLPIPDFDETGFIGRKKDVDDVKKLILCNKVVSIIGDGGVGKTALALKAVYDIVDMQRDCPFELIIWTSAKTTMLTAKGIENINTTIKSLTGLLDDISSAVGAPTPSQSDNLAEILDNLSLFKTLLIIDNLETIQSEEIKQFIREAQMRCNIVITSRIGLGELEFPKPLEGLSQVESVNLLREIAKIRNSSTLLGLPQGILVNIAEKLYFNPLALKWFVSSVQSGITPNEVLNNKGDLLAFCLANVYDKLGENAVRIVDTIRGARKNLNLAEIIFLSGMQPLDVRKAINELFTTTLVAREFIGNQSVDDLVYYITDFAKDFLSKNYPLNPEAIKSISAKLKELSEDVSKINQLNRYNEFGLSSLIFRSSNEKIAAKFLTEALSLSRAKDIPAALLKVEEAKGVVPNYFENYRVGAFIKATAGDFLGAEDDYLTALDIEPDNSKLLYYYAQFLLFQVEDAEKALEFAEKLRKLRPDHPYPGLLLARCLHVFNRFDESIATLKELIKLPIDAKNKLIACSDLISTYQDKASFNIKIEDNHAAAIDNFKLSMEVFRSCADEKMLDIRIIKKFTDSLYLFIISITPVLNQENKEYIRLLIETYYSRMHMTGDAEKIVVKYKEKFNDSSLDSLLLASPLQETSEGRSIGEIKSIRDLKRGFIFIKSGDIDLFAHKNSLKGISEDEWMNLKKGQGVSFLTKKEGDRYFAYQIDML